MHGNDHGLSALTARSPRRRSRRPAAARAPLRGAGARFARPGRPRRSAAARRSAPAWPARAHRPRAARWSPAARPDPATPTAAARHERPAPAPTSVGTAATGAATTTSRPSRCALRSARLSSAWAHCRASAMLSARSPGPTARLGFIAISTAPKCRPADRQRDHRARRRAVVLLDERRRGDGRGVGAHQHLVGGQQLHRLADHVIDDGARSSSPASRSASASSRPSHSPSAGGAAPPRPTRSLRAACDGVLLP